MSEVKRSTCKCHAVIDLVEQRIGFGRESDAKGGESARDADSEAALESELDENGILGMVSIGEYSC